MSNEENKILSDNNIDNQNINIEYDVLLENLEKKYISEIDGLNITIKEQEKNIIYLKADIENIKRNSFKEIQNNVNRQTSKVINSFLLILDDYQRSIEYGEKTLPKDLLDGLLITYNAFFKVLKDLEVVEIDTIGSLFDPSLHEAISVINDSTKENNTIAQVVQRGFKYKNQVLRPAKVIIYSH